MACSLPQLLGEGFCSERCHPEQHKDNSCLGEQGQGRHLPDCTCRTKLGACRDSQRSKQNITRAWPTAWAAFNTAQRPWWYKQPGNAASLTRLLSLDRKQKQTKALVIQFIPLPCFTVLFAGHLLDKHFPFLLASLTQLLGTSEPCSSQHHSWARPQDGDGPGAPSPQAGRQQGSWESRCQEEEGGSGARNSRPSILIPHTRWAHGMALFYKIFKLSYPVKAHASGPPFHVNVRRNGKS